jgi:lysozyme
MSLRTTEIGLQLIKTFEGRKLAAYRCPAGVWTIGYGHTSRAGPPAVTPGLKISAAQATQILRDDIDLFETEVETLVQGVDLEPHQFDALVSLAFNIGVPALKSSTLLKRVRAGRFEDVPAQVMRWNKIDGKTLAGLTRRRRAECALWRGDLEDAERYLGTKFDVMPQKVDAPVPPKTMAESKTGNASIAGAAVGGASLIDAAIERADKAAGAAQKADGWIPFLERLASTPQFWAALVIVAICAFIWVDRRRKLVEEHV